MVHRLAIILIIGALGFGGCKKSGHGAKGTQLLNPSPAPSSAALTPVPASAPPKPVVDQNAQVIVFGYHRFVNKVRRPDTEITPEAFEAQMKELKDRGISVLGMQDFLAWKRGEKNIPPKAAIITIDDGYKSGFEVAWPILKKYGYPVTMFIYTEGIKGGRFGGGEAMSWQQLAEMRDAGVDIQAHTQTHQDLRKPYDKVTKRRLSPPEYEQWLQNEVAGSKQTLEEKLGIKVNCFAVPYGFYNEHVKEVAKKAGYEALFTVYGQKLTYGAPKDSLGRYMIEANKPKVFADAINFGGSTSGGSVPVESIATASLQPQPADGATITDSAPLIQANLSAIAQIDPGSLQMRISGLGLVPVKFDPKTKIVSYKVSQKLREKSCTVIVAAKSGGKKIEAHWSFNLNENAGKGAASPGPTISPTTAPSPATKKP
ncbi:MAG: polysaccharide deacetylase family protein [Verrucomicrobiota bacterium]